MLEEVQRVLEEVRPNLQMDGGDVELVKVEGGEVFVRLKGHCIGCPVSALTVKQGLEVALRQMVPGVERVIAVS
ncbi:MAG: NifU family protein [Thermaerobacter sp.]|nr:NifU family protein [Thermaerobacter sp.]